MVFVISYANGKRWNQMYGRDVIGIPDDKIHPVMGHRSLRFTHEDDGKEKLRNIMYFQEYLTSTYAWKIVNVAAQLSSVKSCKLFFF